MCRKRFSQEWVRSTTHRLALKPASCSRACASSPRVRIWAVKPNSLNKSRTPSKSYPLSKHIPCGAVSVGVGRPTGTLSRVWRANLKSSRLAPAHRQSQRDAFRIGQHTAFGPAFGAVRRIGPGVLSPQAAPWSWRRPSRASSNRCPSGPRTRAIPAPIAARYPCLCPLLKAAVSRIA